jgi:hypothetical protein
MNALPGFHHPLVYRPFIAVSVFKSHAFLVEQEIHNFQLHPHLMKTSFILILLCMVAHSSLAQTTSTNPYLKKYAGAYRMAVNGETITKDTDRYVLSADGTCTWTIFTPASEDGSVPQKADKKPGKWTASEGLIQIFIDGFAEGELLTDFRLEDGVFKAESVYLKKEAAQKKK